MSESIHGSSSAAGAAAQSKEAETQDTFFIDKRTDFLKLQSDKKPWIF